MDARSFFRRLSAPRARGRYEREMSDEMRFHMEAYTNDLVRGGMAPEEAQRRARVEFGPQAALQEECREARGIRVFDELRQDLLDHNVNFPFIEIAQGSNIVEVASWMGDRMSRISRDANAMISAIGKCMSFVRADCTTSPESRVTSPRSCGSGIARS